MKRALMITMLAVSLSGCSYYSDSMAIAKQDYACRNNGGVYKYGNAIFLLRCMDGKEINAKYVMRYTIPPEFYPKKERQ